MATRETRLERGRRHGRDVTRRLVVELLQSRQLASVSQRELAQHLGLSQSTLSRLERLTAIDEVSVVELAEIASLLGLELTANLHPAGPPIRDKGHQALLVRFRSLVAASWTVRAEVPLPAVGDRRSWDLVLRLGQQVVGVEAETRIRDVQSLVRRIRQRERDGGVDEIVLALSDSRSNRALSAEFRQALGEEFATSPRAVLQALRTGHPLSGSGVVLV